MRLNKKDESSKSIKNRFRGFLPIVVDVETSGVDPQNNALLEVSMVFIEMDTAGNLSLGQTISEHILPFEGSVLDPKSMEFNQIDPYQPLRFAVEEKVALQRLFSCVHTALTKTNCQRAVLVGHNAWFDLLFIKEAVKRSGLKLPFHEFTCFDTATLAGMAFGQTVLAKAAKAADIPFDMSEAHSAIYDAEKTAALFCKIANLWKDATDFSS